MLFLEFTGLRALVTENKVNLKDNVYLDSYN